MIHLSSTGSFPLCSYYTTLGICKNEEKNDTDMFTDNVTWDLRFCAFQGSLYFLFAT